MLSCAIFSQDLTFFCACDFNYHSTSSNQNQIVHDTRCIALKHVTCLRGPSPRHCAWATQLLLKKCRTGGEPLQHCIWFDWPEIWTSDRPLQKQARRQGWAFRGCASPNDCLCPQTKIVPPSEDCAPKKLTGLGLLECKSRPKTPKLVFTALEFASKNCVFVIFVD